MPTSNITHRKQLARALAEQTSLGYQQALTEVNSAADAGMLPARLDERGRALALSWLVGQHQSTAGRSHTKPAPCAEPHTGPFTRHDTLTETIVALHQVADLIHDTATAWSRAWAVVAATTPCGEVRQAAQALTAADGLEPPDALAAFPGLFSPVTVALVRDGIGAGRLFEALRTAAVGMERDRRLRDHR